MRRVQELEVWRTACDGELPIVERLAINSRGFIGFTPDSDFLKTGVRLSPFLIPQGAGPFLHRFDAEENRTFHGLFGLFVDCGGGTRNRFFQSFGTCNGHGRRNPTQSPLRKIS